MCVCDCLCTGPYQCVAVHAWCVGVTLTSVGVGLFRWGCVPAGAASSPHCCPFSPPLLCVCVFACVLVRGVLFVYPPRCMCVCVCMCVYVCVRVCDCLCTGLHPLCGWLHAFGVTPKEMLCVCDVVYVCISRHGLRKSGFGVNGKGTLFVGSVRSVGVGFNVRGR